MKRNLREAFPSVKSRHRSSNRARSNSGCWSRGVRDYAIYILNTTGLVATWNSGAQRIKGYQPEEIAGKHFSCFYRPEDIKAGKPNRSLQIAAAEGRYEEETCVRKDGLETTMCLASGGRYFGNVIITALYNRDGELYGFAKVVRDISERRNRATNAGA
jgi:PAS domain S-box-containing protein